MNRLRLLLAATLGLLLLSALLHIPSEPPVSAQVAKARAEWTLLLYCDADCDLEAPTIEQLAQLTSVGGSKDVNVVLLVDRSPLGEDDEDGYSNEPLGNIKNWKGAKLLVAEQGKFVALADWGVVNMGDPATLVQFVQAASRRYPAKKYGLFLGDHGSGWPGVCSDDSHDGDHLSLPKLAVALQAISRQWGKLELIGFDACLMANLETAHTVAPYARYMVASEELEPGCGWDYPPVLTALKKNPQMTGAQLGKLICDRYKAQFDKSEDEDDRATGLVVTLSVLDLAKIGEIEKAIRALSDRSFKLIREEERKGFLKLARVRSRAEEYGGWGEGEGAACHDLKHLSGLIRKQDKSAGPACDALEKALQAAVIHNVHGKGRPHAGGLSIYFPRDGEQFDADSQQEYAAVPFALSSRWGGFLQRYAALADAGVGRAQLKEVKVTRKVIRPDKDETITVSSSVDLDVLDHARFVLAMKEGKKKIIIGQMEVEPEDDGEVSFEWDGRWFVIGNKDHWLLCPIVDAHEVEDEEDAYVVEVPAQVRKQGRRAWTNVMLHFYVEFDGKDTTGKFVYAFQDTSAGPRQIKIGPGDAIRPVYLEVDAKGNEHRVASDKKEDILTLRKKGDLKVGYTEIGKGTFHVGFTATDLAGNLDEEDVEVQVK